MAKGKDSVASIASFEGFKHNVSDEDIRLLVEENKRRMDEIFGPYDPFTGLHCYDFENRIKFECSDFLAPVTYVPKDCLDNVMFRQIHECKSIARYLTERANMQPTGENIAYVQKLICQIRFKCDPEFAIYITDKIQDKLTGEMIPFKLNYPQRILLKNLEDSRRQGKGTYIVLLKARQWGGSTLTQLYMKWIQDYLHEGWNAIVIAQTKKTSKKIKAMYKKAVQMQDPWTIGADSDIRLELKPYENSQDDFIVTDGNNPLRRNVLTVSAFEIVDNDRGENYHMSHCSEVAYWKQTQEHDPEAVISSILGGIRNQQDNIVVFESTGRGASGFFYDTYQTAKDPDTPSLFKDLFIPFYIIENDHEKLDESQEDFARWLLENRDSSLKPKGYKESGKFFWRLWKLGASFEAINWYRVNRNAARDHATWATEAPVDDIEAFKTSGNLIFNPYAVAELRDEMAKDPVYYADINLIGDRGKKMISESQISFRDDGVGELKIWSLPNNQIMKAKNRYLVSVDIGGNSARADYSVMTVIDRIGLIPGVGGKPEVVARYRSHCRHDKLAWKAAVLARYYDNALLVIESNTADRERNSNTEGDHFGSIIEQIANYYDNLYTRAPSSEAVSEKPLQKFGFQTNRLNKMWIIDNLVAFVEDKLFADPDTELYHELSIYERREDGSLGNIPGNSNHDDVLMSLAIGLWVSSNEMDMPDWIRNNVSKKSKISNNLNEAAF